MATADTAKLIALLELQDKFSKPLGNADRALGNFDSKFSRVSSNVGRGVSSLAGNLVRVGTIATGAVVGGLTASVVAASNLNEEIDKSKVVFGEAADGLMEFADGAAAIGLSKAEALGAAGAFGNMFNTVGLAQEESADMSETMVQLAADMASFNNEDPSEMLDRLRSGLSGEAEPLRRFGVLLSEAEVKAFAYSEGIAEAGDKLTEAEKVQARYGLILEQTAIQQGNFADTSDSLANQQRQLRANLSNTASTIGQTLLPSISKVTSAINEVFINKQPQIEQFGVKVGDALAGMLTDANIQQGMDAIGGFIDDLAGMDFSGVGGVFAELGNLPWAAIGDSARLLGTGSKALLDAFLALPPWVQTAVLTGWGLNKLTGGALGGIVGELGKGLIKGVLNMNAGVVNVNAKTVTGGGGAFGGGGKTGGGKFNPFGGVGGVLKFLGPIGAALAVADTAGVFDTRKNNVQAAGNKVVPVKDAETSRKLDRVSGRLTNVSGAVAGLGPRIDRVATVPHRVTADVNVNTAVNVGVSVLQQQFYRTEYVRDLSRISTNTAGI